MPYLTHPYMLEPKKKRGRKRKIDKLAELEARATAAAIANAEAIAQEAAARQQAIAALEMTLDPDCRVPVVSLDDGTRLTRDDAPKRKDLAHWLEKHPGYIVEHPEMDIVALQELVGRKHARSSYMESSKPDLLSITGDEHIPVINRDTGQRMTGSKAPPLKLMAEWLEQNPNWDVDSKWGEIVKAKGNLPKSMEGRVLPERRRGRPSRDQIMYSGMLGPDFHLSGLGAHGAMPFLGGLPGFPKLPLGMPFGAMPNLGLPGPMLGLPPGFALPGMPFPPGLSGEDGDESKNDDSESNETGMTLPTLPHPSFPMLYTHPLMYNPLLATHGLPGFGFPPNFPASLASLSHVGALPNGLRLGDLEEEMKMAATFASETEQKEAQDLSVKPRSAPEKQNTKSFASNPLEQFHSLRDEAHPSITDLFALHYDKSSKLLGDKVQKHGERRHSSHKHISERRHSDKAHTSNKLMSDRHSRRSVSDRGMNPLFDDQLSLSINEKRKPHLQFWLQKEEKSNRLLRDKRLESTSNKNDSSRETLDKILLGTTITSAAPHVSKKSSKHSCPPAPQPRIESPKVQQRRSYLDSVIQNLSSNQDKPSKSMTFSSKYRNDRFSETQGKDLTKQPSGRPINDDAPEDLSIKRKAKFGVGGNFKVKEANVENLVKKLTSAVTRVTKSDDAIIKVPEYRKQIIDTPAIADRTPVVDSILQKVKSEVASQQRFMHVHKLTTDAIDFSESKNIRSSKNSLDSDKISDSVQRDVDKSERTSPAHSGESCKGKNNSGSDGCLADVEPIGTPEESLGARIDGDCTPTDTGPSNAADSGDQS